MKSIDIVKSVFEHRLKQSDMDYLQSPPPEDWGGVHVMTEK